MRIALTLILLICPSWSLVVWKQVPINNTLPKSFSAGQPFLIPNGEDWPKPKLNSMDLIPVKSRNQWLGFAPLNFSSVSLFSVKGKTSAFLRHPVIQYSEAVLSVEHDRPKRASSIRLPANVRKKLEDPALLERRRAEWQESQLALKPPWNELSNSCWKAPLRSKQTSKFGSYRQLPSGRVYYHSGQDLRAPTGTPISTAADGVVTYAGEMVVPGRNVVVSHGDGLFSRYMHLSRVEVKKGDIVKRGQLIGFSGDSGRVEAPHLHWEVIWRGNHVNPSQFLTTWEQLCDPTLTVSI